MRILVIASLVAVVMVGPSLALGAGDGGGDDMRTPAGKPEDPDYTAAVKAIKAQDYAAAIRLLEGVVKRESTNADAFNWLAYAIRKDGNPSKSLPIYEQALALDPKHRGAHEYIGEAYLAMNNLPKAKEHLARLNSLCFFPCSEYSDLKKAIQTYEGGRGRSAPAGR